MTKSVAKVFKAAKVKSVAIEADALTLQMATMLEDALPNVNLEPTAGLISKLRAIKDAGEIEAIRHAIAIAQQTFDIIRASLRPEQTEQEIANAIDHNIRLLGGSGCSFTPIVGVGPQAALPHANPGKSRVADNPLLLIDWGARANLYISDLTRVLFTGKPTTKHRRIYETVLKAQTKAIAAIKPGALMKDVDQAARGVIADAKHAKHFGHGLGHGIGLQVHEQPRLSPISDEPLQVGMVVTVEPGIYLPGWGGVRIEDDVLVTKDGHEVLSSTPKDFESSIVCG